MDPSTAHGGRPRSGRRGPRRRRRRGMHARRPPGRAVVTRCEGVADRGAGSGCRRAAPRSGPQPRDRALAGRAGGSASSADPMIAASRRSAPVGLLAGAREPRAPAPGDAAATTASSEHRQEMPPRRAARRQLPGRPAGGHRRASVTPGRAQGQRERTAASASPTRTTVRHGSAHATARVTGSNGRRAPRSRVSASVTRPWLARPGCRDRSDAPAAAASLRASTHHAGGPIGPGRGGTIWPVRPRFGDAPVRYHCGDVHPHPVRPPSRTCPPPRSGAGSSSSSRSGATRWCPARASSPRATRRCCSRTPAWSSSRTRSAGVEKRDYVRAVDYQRCLRVAGKHNDFEEVGRTPRHHTLFEMLGNWSFGDYFKREAIHWAWDFLTRDLEVPAERLAATVYTTDDVAHGVWKDEIGLPPERLVRWGDFPAGDEKNWWRMADVGPCGPCSELHYDRGAHLSEGPECVPDHSEHCPRWLEVWNLVFMEFELHPDRTLTPLPAPGVDTGHGPRAHRERRPGRRQQLRHGPVRPDPRPDAGAARAATRTRSRRSASATRSSPTTAVRVTFLVADGVLPSNEGRGYVLRRIMRRAIRHGRLLGRREPFLGETAKVVIDTMAGAYPHLAERRDEILGVIAREERQFNRTLEAGVGILEEALIPLTSEERVVGSAGGPPRPGRARPPGRGRVPPPRHLRLPDRPHGRARGRVRRAHGPRGLRGRARRAARAQPLPHQVRPGRGRHRRVALRGDPGPVGAHRVPGLRARPRPRAGSWRSCATAWSTRRSRPSPRSSCAPRPPPGPSSSSTARRSTRRAAARSPTPASCAPPTGRRCSRWTTSSASPAPRPPGLTVHRGVLHGAVRVGDVLRAEVDAERRAHTMRNHTGTHLLHRALRNVVGERARQAGSLVHPDYLRFDFPFDRALTDEEKRTAIEREVRGVVRDDRPGQRRVDDDGRGEGRRRRRVLRREVRRACPHDPGRGVQPRAVRRDALPGLGPDRQLRHHRRAEHRVRHAPDRGRDRRRRGPPDGGALRRAGSRRRRRGRPARPMRSTSASRPSRTSCARRSAASRPAPGGGRAAARRSRGASRGARGRRPLRGRRAGPRVDRRAQGVRQGRAGRPPQRRHRRWASTRTSRSCS